MYFLDEDVAHHLVAVLMHGASVRQAAVQCRVCCSTARAYQAILRNRGCLPSICVCGRPRHSGWCSKRKTLLDQYTCQAVVWYLMRGYSVREVTKRAYVNAHTVVAYRKVLKSHACLPKSCRCGRPPGHKGWCPHRTALSPKRQALMLQWRKNKIGSARLYASPRLSIYAALRKLGVAESRIKAFRRHELAPQDMLAEAISQYKQYAKSFHPDRNAGNHENSVQANLAWEHIEKWFEARGIKRKTSD